MFWLSWADPDQADAKPRLSGGFHPSPEHEGFGGCPAHITTVTVLCHRNVTATVAVFPMLALTPKLINSGA